LDNVHVNVYSPGLSPVTEILEAFTDGLIGVLGEMVHVPIPGAVAALAVTVVDIGVPE
jgi:hypothetical protein